MVLLLGELFHKKVLKIVIIYGIIGYQKQKVKEKEINIWQFQELLLLNWKKKNMVST